MNLIDLTVLACFYFFSALLFLSLTGLFSRFWLCLILVIGLILFWFFRSCFKLNKYYFVFFLLFFLFFIGLVLFKGRLAGDGFRYWLLWAREIAEQGRMPDFLFSANSFVICRMPLMVLLMAGFFELFSAHEFLALIVPFFFLAMSALLVYNWSQMHLKKPYWIFAPLLVLFNPVTLKWAWDFHQEALILFFFTAFFYYLEKYYQSNKFLYFFLLCLSLVLAIASKLTGFILVPVFLIYLIARRKTIPRSWLIGIVFLFFPIIIWLLRNYFVYLNPFAPYFNELFKGVFYGIIRLSEGELLKHSVSDVFDSFSTRLKFLLQGVLFEIFPFVLLTVYGFFQKKKSSYFLILVLFFLLASSKSFFIDPNQMSRYLYPLLGLFVVYGLAGLEQAKKSKLFISVLFFLALLGLFDLPLSLATSHFSLERILSPLALMTNFILQNKIIIAGLFSLFFYFWLIRKKHYPYLFLLIFCSYLVKNSTSQISWPNVWGPVLFVLFAILIWPFLIKLKKLTLRRLVIGYLILLLFLNSWGLALASFASQRKITFPKTADNDIRPEAGIEIEKREGQNRDFYVYVVNPSYLGWHHHYKVVSPFLPTLYYVTDLKYRNSLEAEEIYQIFKESGIEYILENMHRAFWQDFFDQVKKRPDLFEPILEKNTYTLWRLAD